MSLDNSSMSYSTGKFDPDCRFYAAVTSKLGKKNISIYFISSGLDASSTLQTVFELDSSSELVSFGWIEKPVKRVNKVGKRRRSVHSDQHTSSDSLSYLFVVLRHGHILIYSPFQKEPVNEIELGEEITASTGSKDSLWIVLESKIVLEFEIEKSTPKTKFVLTQNEKNITSIKDLYINQEPHLIIGGNKLTTYSATGKLYIEFPGIKGIKDVITSILVEDDDIFVSRESETSIYIYSIAGKKHKDTIHTEFNIRDQYLIDKNQIAASTTQGPILLISGHEIQEIHPNSSYIKFESLGVQQRDIVISWFDFEPRFERMNLENLEDKIIELDVKHVSKIGNGNGSNADLKPLTRNLVTDPNLELEVSEAELVSLIESTKEAPEELLPILIANSGVDKIKYASSSISEGTASAVLSIVIAKVQEDPSESSDLNSWLKWLLLAHGSRTKPSELKPLKTTLTRSLEKLPNLLGLQGRLELLKAQLELRSQARATDIIEADSSLALIEKAEDNIVYLNGENDDQDDVDVIGSVGHSDTGEESSDDEESAESAT